MNNDDDTDFPDLVETITTGGDKLSRRSHNNYAAQTVPDCIPTGIPEQPRTSNINYFHICIALFMALLCLLTGAGVLWYRYRSRKLMRTGSAQSDVEMSYLSSNNS